ncbi:MAG: ankyrin repeat domain-containing protein [Candidatus Hydrogenedentales bacterium]|jgi:ankyrin repeat protein
MDNLALGRALEKDAEVITFRTRDGWSALHEACTSNNLVAMQLLLEHGADVNARDYAGRSPLQFAALTDSAESVELLIRSNADVNSKDALGFTALHYSVLCGDKSNAARALLAHGARWDAALPKDGELPLHIAARCGYAGSVRELLSSGANVDARNNDGETPLYLSVFSRQEVVVRMLLESGANPDIENVHGESALELAASERNVDLLRILKSGETAGNGDVHAN